MQSTTTLENAGNGQKQNITKIGEFHCAKDFKKRLTGQTACNWTDVLVKKGTYDITTDGYWVFVKTYGEIVGDYYVNRLFSATSVETDKNVGALANAGAQLNGYVAAEQFATNPEWELAEDWSVEMVTRRFADGRSYKSFKLIEPS